MEDEDIDFDDLLGEERAAALAAAKPKVIFDPEKAPSENELRLGRRTVELERERDALAAELRELRAKQATSPSQPIAIETIAESDAPLPPITIPHELLPTLTLLRQHIHDLTKDNEALRYTFLGHAAPSRSSGPIRSTPTPTPLPTPTVPGAGSNATVPVTGTIPAAVAPSSPLPIPIVVTSAAVDPAVRTAGVEGVDLEKVLARVKSLMSENDELGQMLLEAGRTSEEDLEAVLAESKAVIESLDSDLTQHLDTVQSLRSDLQAYRNHFGPLPSTSGGPASGTVTTSGTLHAPSQPSSQRGSSPRHKSQASLSMSRPDHSQASSVSHSSRDRVERERRGGDRHRDSDRPRDKDREDGRDKDRDRTRDRVRERDDDRHSASSSIRDRDRERERDRDRAKDKDRVGERDRDRDHDRERNKDDRPAERPLPSAARIIPGSGGVLRPEAVPFGAPETSKNGFRIQGAAQRANVRPGEDVGGRGVGGKDPPRGPREDRDSKRRK